MRAWGLGVSALLVMSATMAGLVVGWLCWQWATRLLGTSEGLVPVPAACVSCAVVWGLTCGFLGLGALSLELLVLCVPLVTLSLADFAVRIIPNECVLAVLAVHLCRVAMQVAQGSLGLGQALAQVLAGGACALVPLLALTLGMGRVLQAESMGGGDLKLLAAGGVCVGWRLLPFLLSAKEVNPSLKVWASPWCPKAFRSRSLYPVRRTRPCKSRHAVWRYRLQYRNRSARHFRARILW